MGYLREMANEIAAQCWTTEKNKHKDMDPDLAEEFANRLTAWLETLAQAERNKDFYQGLLDQCAEHLGPEAYTDDDGTLHDSPMRIKLPSMVRELVDVWKAHRKGLFVSSTVMTSRCQESYAAGKVDGVNEDVNNRCERMVDVKYRDRVIHSVNFELAGKIKKILVYAEEVGFEEGKAAGVLDGISRNNKRWIDYLRDNYDTGNVLSIGNQKYLVHTENMMDRIRDLAEKRGEKRGERIGDKRGRDIDLYNTVLDRVLCESETCILDGERGKFIVLTHAEYLRQKKEHIKTRRKYAKADLAFGDKIKRIPENRNDEAYEQGVYEAYSRAIEIVWGVMEDHRGGGDVYVEAKYIHDEINKSLDNHRKDGE